MKGVAHFVAKFKKLFKSTALYKREFIHVSLCPFQGAGGSGEANATADGRPGEKK